MESYQHLPGNSGDTEVDNEALAATRQKENKKRNKWKNNHERKRMNEWETEKESEREWMKQREKTRKRDQ